MAVGGSPSWTTRLSPLGDTVAFDVRLGETIARCIPRVDARDPRSSLRSDSLKPSVLASGRVDTLHSLVRHRGDLLRWHALSGENPSPEPSRTVKDLRDGRLLFYAVDEQITDGASAAESGGYFDVEDAPPWDS